MLKLLQRFVNICLLPLRWLLDKAFVSQLNPLKQLGALTIFFCWIVLVSGIWLLIFFRTSVEGAYQSIEQITYHQWYFGSVMRSLHRYASDAAVITLGLHIIKEFAVDHHRGKHWFSWVTGIPLIWLLFPLGITGYWLVWDEMAHYVALTSAELLDWLPIFTDSMARNFLTDKNMSDRFFTLMAFLHVIGLPLFLIFAIWLHVIRINSPRINPPRFLMIIVLIALTILSLLYPAISQNQVNLTQMPQSLGLDWFYLMVYPLIQFWPIGWVWALLIGLSLLLFLAPWLPPVKNKSIACVNLKNCNGCERCVNDCPYGAVAMMPRSDGMAHSSEAVVDADLCTNCGICVGACPTATPFRSRSELIPGIDLKDLSAAQIRTKIHQAAEQLSENPRVLIICCQGSEDAKRLNYQHKGIIEIACMAHLPPSFLDYILARDIAEGILMTGCSHGECKYRFGMDWTGQRIMRQRDPRLRKRVDDKRIALAWQAPWSEYHSTEKALAAFKGIILKTSVGREKI